MLAQLAALSFEERLVRSGKICERIIALASWRSARNVVLFSPLRAEPAIDEISAATHAAEKHFVVVPKTLRGAADFALPFVADLVLVPGLAFSRKGNRLGRGGGFYDRFLGKHCASATKVGVCFSFQVLDTIPTEPHDATVDIVVSDSM